MTETPFVISLKEGENMTDYDYLPDAHKATESETVKSRFQPKRKRPALVTRPPGPAKADTLGFGGIDHV